ncbi:MAG: DUF4203 domain-containing protein [Nitrospirae bacterium]|nr:DUF4203 domain-containing protein [Nitrospirota bacterium]
MTFELFCIALIGLAFGAAMVFGGYRLFLVLLPIWGFFFGFGLGAQTIQVIFGEALLASVTSWVVGFVVGLIFAVLSYLFYLFAVAVLSFSFGYGLTVGVWTAIGLDPGLISWVLGIIVGAVIAGAVLALNLQKYAIIVITAVAGAGVSILTILAVVYGPLVTNLLESPVKTALGASPLLLIFGLAVASAGVVAQLRDTRHWEIETYNRLATGTAY